MKLNFLHLSKKRLYIWASVTFALCFSASTLLSQSILTDINVNGTAVTSTTNVRIALPNQQPKSGISIAVNSQFPAGTIIETPANTSLRFRSVNGNFVDLPGNSKIRLSASTSGESYTSYLGKAIFYVQKQVGFFNVSDSNGKVTGASKNTQYSIDVTKDVVTFNTTEGAITLYQKVPVQINQASQNSNKNQNRELSTFSSQSQDQNSGAVAINVNNMQPKVFNSYEEAIAASTNNIQLLQQTSHSLLQIADESAFIAYIYLDAGAPSKAIPYLDYAIDAYATIDEYDPYISELYLDLAEAYLDAGDINTGSRLLADAVLLLQEDLEFAIDDYNYSISTGYADLIWIDGTYLADTYDNLSWAYFLYEDESKELYYEQQADIIRSQL